VRIVGRKDFVNVAKKNIEREPVNALFLLAEMCLSTTTRRINGACLQAATSIPGTGRVELNQSITPACQPASYSLEYTPRKVLSLERHF
jgi:hypothetical protein